MVDVDTFVPEVPLSLSETESFEDGDLSEYTGYDSDSGGSNFEVNNDRFTDGSLTLYTADDSENLVEYVYRGDISFTDKVSFEYYLEKTDTEAQPGFLFGRKSESEWYAAVIDTRNRPDGEGRLVIYDQSVDPQNSGQYGLAETDISFSSNVWSEVTVTRSGDTVTLEAEGETISHTVSDADGDIGWFNIQSDNYFSDCYLDYARFYTREQAPTISSSVDGRVSGLGGEHVDVSASSRKAQLSNVSASVDIYAVGRGRPHEGIDKTDFWTIGSDIPGDIAEESTVQDLRLSFLLSKSKKRRIDMTASEAGELETDSLAGGRFRATDMAGGDNTYYLSAPRDRGDVSYTGEVLVDDYTETRAEQRGEQFRVSVDFVKRDQREPSDDLVSETADPDEWLFEFSDGAIATKTGIDAESISENVSGIGSFSVRLLLTYEQTRVIRECPTRLTDDGVEEVETRDSSDEVVDNTGGRNTVTVTAPTGGEDILGSGDYVVTDWSTEWKGQYYEVSLELSL